MSEKNKRRQIIIGDVHGCLHELEKLLAKLEFHEEKDELFFVGDLINKGPNSLGVLELARNLNAACVIGNHELNFLDHLAIPSKRRPGFDQLQKEMGTSLSQWVAWIKRWPSYIERDDFLVVHAGLAPGKHPSKTSTHILANIRTWDGTGANMNNKADPPWFDLYTHQKTVVYGHWALMGLHVRKNTIGLDTGCVYGKKLTAVILPSKEIVSVDADRTYVSTEATIEKGT